MKFNVREVSFFVSRVVHFYKRVMYNVSEL